MTTIRRPDRDDRIDLQPDNAISRVYNIDPSTGLPLDPQYEVRDSGGNLIFTDGDGNVLFNGLTTFNSLSVENIEGAREFTKTVTSYDLDALMKTLDFNISELLSGTVNSLYKLPSTQIVQRPKMNGECGMGDGGTGDEFGNNNTYEWDGSFGGIYPPSTNPINDNFPPINPTGPTTTGPFTPTPPTGGPDGWPPVITVVEGVDNLTFGEPEYDPLGIIGDPGGYPPPGGDGTDTTTITDITALLDLINKLRDELDACYRKLKECELLQGVIDELNNEIEGLEADLADLIDLVEALQSCKLRLERVLTIKNNEIIRISSELARQAVENENMKIELAQQRDRIEELSQQNVELAKRPNEITLESPDVIVNVPTFEQPEKGGGSTGGTVDGSGIRSTGGGTEVTDSTLDDNQGGNDSVFIPPTLKQAVRDTLQHILDWTKYIGSYSTYESTYLSLRDAHLNTSDLVGYKVVAGNILGEISQFIIPSREEARLNGSRSRRGDDRVDAYYDNFVHDRTNLAAEIAKV